MNTREEQLEQALKELIRLHHDWDKGRASITVRFVEMNNAAISAAQVALALPKQQQ